MTRIAISTAFVALVIAAAGAVAQTLSPIPVFENRMTTPAKNGSSQGVHVSVQSWEIAAQGHSIQEIPLRGFYVAHLVSGDISTTIEGETIKQPTGAYWIVKAGAAMQVKVLGEFAVLETTVVAKQ